MSTGELHERPLAPYEHHDGLRDDLRRRHTTPPWLSKPAAQRPCQSFRTLRALEDSDGTRPQNPANAAARPNRRQSPTSLASVSAPSRVMPRQAVHGVGERRPVIPAGQVGPDRLQLRVANLQHRPVVRIGRGRAGSWKRCASSQRSWSGSRRSRPARPGMTQQELGSADAARGCGRRPCQHRPGTGPRPPLPGRWGSGWATSSPARYSRASRRQSRVSVLTLSPGALGISDGAITSQPTPCWAAAGPARSRSGRPGSRLAAAGNWESANQPAPRRLVMGDPLDVVPVAVRGQDRHRDGVLMDVQAEVSRSKVRDTGHGRLLPYVAPSAPSWMTHAPVTCGTGPAAPC
jgi:hypothetical protein